jgi:hypothetical protein
MHQITGGDCSISTATVEYIGEGIERVFGRAKYGQQGGQQCFRTARTLEGKSKVIALQSRERNTGKPLRGWARKSL